MLGGDVQFKQHIDQEAKHHFLDAWGMRESTRTMEKEEVETKKAGMTPSLFCNQP
jgi:hypothetical protein